MVLQAHWDGQHGLVFAADLMVGSKANMQDLPGRVHMSSKDLLVQLTGVALCELEQVRMCAGVRAEADLLACPTVVLDTRLAVDLVDTNCPQLHIGSRHMAPCVEVP